MTTRTVQLDTHTQVTTQMCIWSCPDCGIMYGIPEEYAATKRREAGSYYCPNGHKLSYRESDADRERKRAAKAEQRASRLADELIDAKAEAEGARNRERAQKAAKTRLKNRVGNGVCPCCKRHFANVEKHIKGQHPGFTADDEGAE